MSRKQWCVSPIDKDLASDLAAEFDIDPFVALLLVSRGITDDEEIEDFFSENGWLSDPFELKDMDKASKRIRQAIENGEKIAVYGDYDADGVTSSAIVYDFLKKQGCNVTFYIPDRNCEGYGLNMKAIKSLCENGVELIITVDNGISAFEEAKYIKELGMELVITDHHKASDTIPEAVAVVNPQRYDCPSTYKSWSGVGVAFKLISAVSDESEEEILDRYADIITLGTIGDVVPLVGENRTIVKHGLKLINEGRNKGIKALKNVSGVGNKTVNATSVAFSLVPRINAIGRVSNAEKAFSLLVSENDDCANELAQVVDKANAYRQEIEKNILAEAERQIKENPEMLHQRVLIFVGENWHAGVIGIVAARLVQQYGKPCFVITDDGENAKGSARSIDGFSLYDAVSSAASLLTHYGGHVLAAGFSLKSENLHLFKQAIYDYAKITQMPFPRLQLDCRLRPEFINSDILNIINELEPFGAGNAQPLFGLYSMTITSVQSIGNGKHLRLGVKKGECSLTALLFSVTQSEFPYTVGDVVDLAVKLERNEYMGQVKVSIYVKDIRMSGTDDIKYLKSVRLYEKFKIGEPLSKKQAEFVLADRNDVAEVYRYIKSLGEWSYDTDVLCYRLGSDGSNACRVLVAIDVLCELGIFKKQENTITIADTSKKVNLDDSQTVKYLKGIINKQ